MTVAPASITQGQSATLTWSASGGNPGGHVFVPDQVVGGVLLVIGVVRVEAAAREVTEDSGAPLVMGVDVARKGSNESVILLRRLNDRNR